MTPGRPVYDLLPAAHRARDAELGHPLRGLLEVVEEELLRLRETSTGCTTTGSWRPARSGSCPTSATCSGWRPCRRCRTGAPRAGRSWPTPCATGGARAHCRAGAAGPGRHRVARPRRGVLPAARHHPAPRPHTARQPAHPGSAGHRAAGPSGHPLRPGRPHRGRPARRQRARAVQHRRHRPARVAARRVPVHRPRRARRGRRAGALDLRPGRPGPAAVHPSAERRRLRRPRPAAPPGAPPRTGRAAPGAPPRTGSAARPGAPPGTGDAPRPGAGPARRARAAVPDHLGRP